MRVSEAQPEVCNLKGPDLCQSMRDMFRNPEALLVLIEVRFNQQLQPQLSSSEDHRRNGRVLNMLRDDLLYRHRTALLVVTSTSITADWKQYVSPSIAPVDVGPCIDDARSQRKGIRDGRPFRTALSRQGRKKHQQQEDIPGRLRYRGEKKKTAQYCIYAYVHI